ncbi:hypothetical protein AAFF_G00039640 [Aldrovandia affinis]|uniref:HAT C-terminal dimerisation domain-containing protein n=1 Tax=Aldrovandia affinis TaxID=143900 RepID=A0AAD7S383_9TELE|nr:hypothetical protein AAFF_G00039640 [Aldrovandia affinis]
MLEDIHKDFKVEHKVSLTTTDNGSNFVKAFQVFADVQDSNEEENEEEEDDKDLHFTEVTNILNDPGDEVLAPLAKALDLLQWDKMAYYGVLLPTIATLIEKLQKIKRESKLQYCTPLVDALIGGVKQRFGYVFESRKCLMATACHPMFRMEYILTEQKADTETGLREEVRRLQTPSTSPTADEEEDPVSEDDITSFFPKKKDDRLDEMEVFLKSLDTSLLTAFSPLPKMRRVFIKFNTGVLASAACERLFSVGKDIFTAKRNRLSDKNFERLLMCRVNKRFCSGS